MNFTDIEVGSTYELGPVEITRERIVRFAEEFDPLPFHMDDAYAAKTRFGQLIAPGVMSFMAVWAQFARMNVCGENLLGGMNTKIEWLAPVFAGDVLHGTVTVSGKRRRNPYNGVMELTTEIFNQNGVKVIHDVTEQAVAG